MGLVVAPAPREAAADQSAPAVLTVPILMYHYIRDNPNPADSLGADLSVPPAAFEAQMSYLRTAGASPVTLHDVVAALEGRRPLPPRAVVLTFDDGYADFATAALPILERYGFIATLFAVPGLIGQPGYLSQDQLQGVAEAGMVIGAHTVHHADLTSLPPDDAADEIAVSRDLLRSWTGQPVEDFAYPYGDYDGPIAHLVAGAGFADAVTTDWGVTATSAGRYVLPRVRVGGLDDMATFAGDLALDGPPGGRGVPLVQHRRHRLWLEPGADVEAGRRGRSELRSW